VAYEDILMLFESMCSQSQSLVGNAPFSCGWSILFSQNHYKDDELETVFFGRLK
jgi:hypothetical protein